MSQVPQKTDFEELEERKKALSAKKRRDRMVKTAEIAGGASTIVPRVVIGAKATGIGALTYLGFKALGFLKALFLGLVQGLTNAVAFAASAISSMISAAISSVTAAIISSIVVATLVTTLGVVGAVIVGIVNMQHGARQLDDPDNDCRKSIIAEIGSMDMDYYEVTYENAQKIYSIFHRIGLGDNQIAGLLGNWAVESGIDPTSVEGIFNEPFTYGNRKMYAISHHHEYTTHLIDVVYAKYKINKAQYYGSDGKLWPGIGLPGFTPGSLLIDAADRLEEVWYDLDFQVAYIAATGTSTTTGAKGGVNFWNVYQSETDGQSPSECAMYFTRYYIGNTIMHQPQRAASAEYWKKEMVDWEYDEDYTDRIFEMISELGFEATESAIAGKLNDCQKALKFDNSSIAAAAASFAYPSDSQAFHNDGTLLYRRVLKYIFPSDGIFQSCDRAVAAAVRWSGYDDDFPLGDSKYQILYMQTSDRWSIVGTADKLNMSDLRPGDIFGVDGHVFIYTSHDILKRVQGASIPAHYDSVSASYGERSASCNGDASSIIVENGGHDWYGRGLYTVYRCTKPQHSRKYKDAGSTTN